MLFKWCQFGCIQVCSLPSTPSGCTMLICPQPQVQVRESLFSLDLEYGTHVTIVSKALFAVCNRFKADLYLALNPKTWL